MTGKRHTGYILIMLLIVIVIGLLIYYMDIMWIGGDTRLIRKAPPDQNQPWKYENLIRGPNQPVKSVTKSASASSKPVINKPLELKGEVATKNAKRGQITFTIQPDGTIDGNWQCQYSYTHAAYVISAVFKGNTDVTQTFSGDPSKLFLIAMGDFDQKATNLESGAETQTKGTVYFRGWLNSDFTASGTISITTDKKWHADYNWRAAPQSLSNNNLNL
jgi:hypothetical protein